MFPTRTLQFGTGKSSMFSPAIRLAIGTFVADQFLLVFSSEPFIGFHGLADEQSRARLSESQS